MPKTIQLVFWKSQAPTQEPYTTSEVIAEAAGMNRRTVNRPGKEKHHDRRTDVISPVQDQLCRL